MSVFLNKYLFCSLRFFKNVTNLVYTCKLKYTTKTHVKPRPLEFYTVNENALQHRILKYLQIQKLVSTQKIKISLNYYSPENISVVNNKKLINLISNLPKDLNQKDLQRCVRNLDLECRKRLTEMKINEMFLFINSFINSVPYLVRNLPFFIQSIHKMSFCVEQCSKSELIHLFFYAGLRKKCIESQQVIKQCLNKINNYNLNILTLEDIVILCNASFKTGTKIGQKKILDDIRQRIYNQLSILSDEAFFVTIVKSLRHNYNYDEELLITISNTIFFNKCLFLYNFTALTHILALYGDALHYDSILIGALNDRCVTFLKNMKPVMLKTEYFSNQIRLKDLCRYLWSLSYLGYENLTNDIIENYVISVLKNYIHLGGIEEYIEEFVGTLLSLWILGFHPTDILPEILKNKAILKGKHRKTFVARLNLLLTCIEHEKRDLYKSLNITRGPAPSYNINTQIIRRPHLTYVYKSLQNLSQQYGICSLQYSSEIPHLNIVGITGFDKKNNVKLYAECVDDMTSIKYNEMAPHGFMKLKIRLLKSMNKPVLVLDQEEISELSQADLDKFIGFKLKRMLKNDVYSSNK